MDAKQLKNSILQWAIQGKLVPQIESEGTAEDLLKEIRDEKEKLVKGGKLKKKDLEVKPIEDDEVPFEIPESWKWCRLGDVCYKITDGTHSTPKYVDKGIPFLSVKNLSSGYVDMSNVKYISEEEHNELYKRCNPEYGDILITKVGTTGVPVVNNITEQFSIFVSVALLKQAKNNLCTEFLLYLLNSPLVQEQVKVHTRGVGNKNWVLNDIINTTILMPPLSEQHRIVAKIEELMPLVEEYGKAQEQLEALNKELPEKLKKSVLQEAIMGKLVPQDPNEGTADELLAEIRKEKEKLVKAGKLKKKDLEVKPIEDDEVPFEIPEGWRWCRLGEIAGIYGGKRIPAGSKLTTEDTGHKYIRVADMKNESVKLDDIHYVLEKDYPGIQKYTISKDDLYITVAGTIGSVGEIPSELDNANLTENANKIVFRILDKKFLLKMLSSPFLQNQIKNVTTKVGQPKLAIQRIQTLLVPLPPLSEQKRIVAKVEEVMREIEGMISVR